MGYMYNITKDPLLGGSRYEVLEVDTDNGAAVLIFEVISWRLQTSVPRCYAAICLSVVGISTHYTRLLASTYTANSFLGIPSCMSVPLLLYVESDRRQPTNVLFPSNTQYSSMQNVPSFLLSTCNHHPSSPPCRLLPSCSYLYSTSCSSR